MELGRGSFVEVKWGLTFFYYTKEFKFPYSMSRLPVLRPVTLPQPGLGRIAEQVQVLVA
jgi:hypothetical protein